MIGKRISYRIPVGLGLICLFLLNLYLVNIIPWQNTETQTFNCLNNTDNIETAPNVLMVTFRDKNPNNFEGDKQEINHKYQILSDNKHSYARQWGYKYIEFKENSLNFSKYTDIKVESHWVKPFLMKQLLEQYKDDPNLEFIVWIDTDLAFIDCHIPFYYILKYLPDNVLFTGKHTEFDLIVSADLHSVNNGVFAFRNTEWTMKFINNWIEIKTNPKYAATINHVFQDQVGFIALIMGFDPFSEIANDAKTFDDLFNRHLELGINKMSDIEKVRYGTPEYIRNHTAILPSSYFNSFDQNRGSNNFIIHCAGSPHCKNSLDQYVLKYSNCPINYRYL